MADVVRFPRVRTSAEERDLIEMEAAISLVARGAAQRVQLVGLMAPLTAAGLGAASAAAAGVGFRVERGNDRVIVVVGPRR